MDRELLQILSVYIYDFSLISLTISRCATARCPILRLYRFSAFNRIGFIRACAYVRRLRDAKLPQKLRLEQFLNGKVEIFSLTLVHASVLVLEYSELVNFAKFLKHRP